MNKNYNKHLNIVIVILSITIVILYACTHKDNNIHEPKESNTEFSTCGIDSVYIEDSLHEEYDEVKVDKQGNVYHVNCK